MTKPMMTALVMTEIILITAMVLLDSPARKAEDNVVRIRMIGRHNNHDDKTNDDKTNDDSTSDDR